MKNETPDLPAADGAQDIEFALEWARSRKSDGPPPRCMVPLAEGEGTPLYLVHAATGNIVFAREFAGLLNHGHPVFGFEATGLWDRERPLLSVTEMAERYLTEIKRMQPQGPYLLCGLCAGSQIAYEMACQLMDAGEEIGPLLLVNGARGELDELPLIELADHYELRLAELRRQFGVDNLAGDLPRVMNELRELRWIDEETSEDDFYWRQVIFAANTYAQQYARLGRYKGAVELFLSEWAASDPSVLWQDIAPHCRVHILDAETTIGIMRTPLFATIAGQSFDNVAGRFTTTSKPGLEKLHEIWCHALGVSSVRPTDDFFALGGNSVKATVVTARIRAAMLPELPIRVIFDHPRFDSFSAAIASMTEG